MSKIFVRERQHVAQGARRPRFAIVGVEGTDLKVFHSHVRRAELERIASEIGAEIVYLSRGQQGEYGEQGSHATESADEPAGDGGHGRHHREHGHGRE